MAQPGLSVVPTVQTRVEEQVSVNPLDQGYKMVAERLAQFVIDFPNGQILTKVIQFAVFDNGKGYVVIGAEIYKDRKTAAYDMPDGTGLAGMPIPGPTNFTRNSEVENAETSAIGRALASIGYLAKDESGKLSYASKDEITMKRGDGEDDKITEAQRKRMFAMMREANMNKEQAMVLATAVTGRQIRSSDQLKKSDMDGIFAALEAEDYTATDESYDEAGAH